MENFCLRVRVVSDKKGMGSQDIGELSVYWWEVRSRYMKVRVGFSNMLMYIVKETLSDG